MFKKKFQFCGLAAIVGVAVWGCQADTSPASSQISRGSTSQEASAVYAVSYPLQQVTQQLIGDSVQVLCPTADSPQPDRWRPDRETLSAMQQAKLIVCNGAGAPYAKWMNTTSLPTARLVPAASRGLSLADLIAVEDIQVVHSHGPEGEHSHPTMVSRTWLDPTVLNKQAQFIAAELVQRFPEQKQVINENLKLISQQLNGLAVEFPFQNRSRQFQCLSATPELKFFTRYAQIQDKHFNWTNASSGEDIRRDLTAWREQQDEPTAGQSGQVNVVLVPGRLRSMVESAAPVWQQFKLRPVFVDLIDRPDDHRLWIDRIRENLRIADEL